MPGPRIFLKAERLASPYPGLQLPAGLAFEIGPGLTLLRGGDGRGKTTLLHLIAGIARRSPEQTLCFETPADAAHDDVVVRIWLAARCAQFTTWQSDVEADLIERFALAEHLDKPMFMLSTGSRRKVGLLAAAASGAALTLIDMPFAALDARSGRVLTALLAEAAAGTDRAWVIADHECPANLSLSALIDLGD